MAAIFIDGLILLVPVFGIAWLLSLVFPHHGFFFRKSAVAVPSEGSGASRYTLGLPGLLLVTALYLSYFFIYEALRGQTIGKRAMGLRVRAASGGPAGINQVSARTVLRLVDVLPFLYLLGTLVALLTGSRRRRIGDWVAGTVVVRDEIPADEPTVKADWRVGIYPLMWVGVVLFATLAVGVSTNPSEALLAGGRYQTCAAAGVTEGAEGECVQTGETGGQVLVNVVDGNRTVRMPEYEASLQGDEITPIRVAAGPEEERLYPHGLGQLVSYRVAITNALTTPLRFDPTSSSDPERTTLELALPFSPESDEDMAYPASATANRRAPTPSIFQPEPIPPHATRSGWVSFVTPASSLALLHARPADVDFFRAQGPRNYVGEIRLWK
ncbi:MAG TPA: RDD family protein [Solirubrobacteraceae bacterium]|nr:RDD family protein [Solirubrobacteraceae bacterium]